MHIVVTNNIFKTAVQLQKTTHDDLMWLLSYLTWSLLELLQDLVQSLDNFIVVGKNIPQASKHMLIFAVERL